MTYQRTRTDDMKPLNPPPRTGLGRSEVQMFERLAKSTTQVISLGSIDNARVALNHLKAIIEIIHRFRSPQH